MTRSESASGPAQSIQAATGAATATATSAAHRPRVVTSAAPPSQIANHSAVVGWTRNPSATSTTASRLRA